MATLRATTVFSARNLTVTAIESREIRNDGTGHGLFVSAILKPVAIIISEPNGRYAVGMDGQPVAIEQLNLPADVDLA